MQDANPLMYRIESWDKDSQDTESDLKEELQIQDTEPSIEKASDISDITYSKQVDYIEHDGYASNSDSSLEYNIETKPFYNMDLFESPTAEIIIVHSSLHSSPFQIYDYQKIIQLLICKQATWFDLDLNTDFSNAAETKNEELLQKIPEKDRDAIPTVLIDGFPIKSFLHLQELENIYVLDEVLSQKCCVNLKCLYKRNKEEPYGKCYKCNYHYKYYVTEDLYDKIPIHGCSYYVREWSLHAIKLACSCAKICIFSTHKVDKQGFVAVRHSTYQKVASLRKCLFNI